MPLWRARWIRLQTLQRTLPTAFHASSSDTFHRYDALFFFPNMEWNLSPVNRDIITHQLVVLRDCSLFPSLRHRCSPWLGLWLGLLLGLWRRGRSFPWFKVDVNRIIIFLYCRGKNKQRFFIAVLLRRVPVLTTLWLSASPVPWVTNPFRRSACIVVYPCTHMTDLHNDNDCHDSDAYRDIFCFVFCRCPEIIGHWYHCFYCKKVHNRLPRTSALTLYHYVMSLFPPGHHAYASYSL